jgi:hypothetical protein
MWHPVSRVGCDCTLLRGRSPLRIFAAVDHFPRSADPRCRHVDRRCPRRPRARGDHSCARSAEAHRDGQRPGVHRGGPRRLGVLGRSEATLHSARQTRRERLRRTLQRQAPQRVPNQHWFLDLEDARRIIEEWRIDFNEFRPHSSLDGMTYNEYAKAHAGLTSRVAYRRGAGQAHVRKGHRGCFRVRGRPNSARGQCMHAHIRSFTSVRCCDRATVASLGLLRLIVWSRCCSQPAPTPSEPVVHHTGNDDDCQEGVFDTQKYDPEIQKV